MLTVVCLTIAIKVLSTGAVSNLVKIAIKIPVQPAKYLSD
jgi:hypothetical protein